VPGRIVNGTFYVMENLEGSHCSSTLDPGMQLPCGVRRALFWQKPRGLYIAERLLSQLGSAQGCCATGHKTGPDG
jgi:hypothetical protein